MRLALATAVLGAGCAGVDGPHVTGLAPARARRGELVVLAGEGFCPGGCAAAPQGAVDFGVELPQVRAPVVRWDATEIQVTVPQSIAVGATVVIVTVDDRSSNAVDFEVIP